jgi:hypothetical protein
MPKNGPGLISAHRLEAIRAERLNKRLSPDINPEVRRLHREGFLPKQISAQLQISIIDVRRQTEWLGGSGRRQFRSGRKLLTG